jgi:hypothetical protein
MYILELHVSRSRLLQNRHIMTWGEPISNKIAAWDIVKGSGTWKVGSTIQYANFSNHHLFDVSSSYGQLKKIIRLASFFLQKKWPGSNFLFLLFIFSEHIRVGHNQSNLPYYQGQLIQCESVTTTWITSVTGMSTFSGNRTRRTVTSENCHNPSGHWP